MSGGEVEVLCQDVMQTNNKTLVHTGQANFNFNQCSMFTECCF